MSIAAGDFDDIDGMSVRIRRKAQAEQEHQPAEVNADAQPVSEDAWREFVDRDKWDRVEEAMQLSALAKKWSANALQKLRIGEDEPDHSKWASLNKAILHEAAAETEDPAVAKALLTIAAGYPSALAQIAAEHAEERQAIARVDPVASLRSEAKTYQEALSVRLGEVKEQTAMYQSMHAHLKDLQKVNTEVEAALVEETAKQRAALAENRAAENAIGCETHSSMVSPSSQLTALLVHPSVSPVQKRQWCGTQVKNFEDLVGRVDKTVWKCQGARKDMEVSTHANLHHTTVPLACSPCAF